MTYVFLQVCNFMKAWLCFEWFQNDFLLRIWGGKLYLTTHSPNADLPSLGFELGDERYAMQRETLGWYRYLVYSSNKHLLENLLHGSGQGSRCEDALPSWNGWSNREVRHWKGMVVWGVSERRSISSMTSQHRAISCFKKHSWPRQGLLFSENIVGVLE